MITNPDVRRTASGLIDTYGERAPMACAMRIELFRQRDDMENIAVWESILQAVYQLRDKAQQP
jgi:hypothetical protein